MAAAFAAVAGGLPETPADPALRVRPGDALILAVFAGPVRVEREVTALQPARPGHRLFVRDRQGQVFTARYERAAP